MRLRSLVGALLSIFIIVANDNGLYGYDENRSKSQIQQDQNPMAQSGKIPDPSQPPGSSAYPPLPPE